MDYPKFIVSTQKEGSICIQRLNEVTLIFLVHIKQINLLMHTSISLYKLKFKVMPKLWIYRLSSHRFLQNFNTLMLSVLIVFIL